MLLEGRGLGKRYLGPDGLLRQVVQGVDFTLRAGRTLGIVGESGSGKTTVARIALGLLQPDQGEVLYRGQPWNRRAMPSAKRRGDRCAGRSA